MIVVTATAGPKMVLDSSSTSNCIRSSYGHDTKCRVDVGRHPHRVVAECGYFIITSEPSN